MTPILPTDGVSGHAGAVQADLASIAEFYSHNLATGGMKGMRQKAIQGGTPGGAPLGYLNQRLYIRDNEVRTVVVDPDRGPHIAWAFHA